MHPVRYDWQRDEVRAIYDTPVLDLVFRAAGVHRQFHDPAEVQVCKLISVKTGGCPEDCKYCSQSVHYETPVQAQPMLEHQGVIETARRAKDAGVTRVCLGAAWREIKDNKQFDRVLDMVRDITDLGLEVCCTLGMLNEDQARRLENAGLHAYNHNLDTSQEFYETIITTRKYADRLQTLANVRKTNVTMCSGGIIGLGEKTEDRVAMLTTLASMNPHPESVPINLLSKVDGTPLSKNVAVPTWDLIRMIATARLIMPRAVVRLSAGRSQLSEFEQALCFLAGANSIFSSETGHMLTEAVPSPDYDTDRALLQLLGLKTRPPFKGVTQSEPANANAVAV